MGLSRIDPSPLLLPLILENIGFQNECEMLPATSFPSDVDKQILRSIGPSWIDTRPGLCHHILQEPGVPRRMQNSPCGDAFIQRVGAQHVLRARFLELPGLQNKCRALVVIIPSSCFFETDAALRMSRSVKLVPVTHGMGPSAPPLLPSRTWAPRRM